ncbi:hypothetical protein [Bradyrhizobium sp. Ec3.3]|uniref:hypothetical protein n=1 Tax=Bradyrhizobium sp. Ec3.3 TaxID=189753 RepID=UPI0004815C41|nr:hypothetical protein [Bradyrhizobium sp. Ec3.3]
MTVSNVTRLRKIAAPPPPAPVARSAGWRRKIARQRFAAYAVAGVALVLTGLSLSHLAAGVQMLSQGTTWHAWAMAVGIDLGFIGLELAQLCVTTAELRRHVSRFADPAVKGTLIVSAAMNAYAFAIHAPSWPFIAAACLLGVSIPALIYVLTRVSVAMWIDCQK